MSDETPARSAEATDRGGYPGGSGEGGSPLQARAAFLENWNWDAIVSINRGACARGGAQHGINSEAGSARGAEWEQTRARELTLAETFDFLRACHRAAPFLFFNGNTFATVGRELSFALFSDLPATRKRELGSAVAHYIAGVLDRESMVSIVESLCRTAALKPGDRVQTLKGTLRGRIMRVLEDGRVAWKPEGAAGELIALPESLSVLDSAP